MPQPDAALPVIVPTNSGALTTTTGPQRIATRMAENLLGVARSQERALAAQRRYRIGDYEFREADHAQIQRWARRLGMANLLDGLARSRKLHWFGNVTFRIQDGVIVSLVWDFALLQLIEWNWITGLEITRLAIVNALSKSLPALPGCLRELICSGNSLTRLELRHLPKLQKLDCGYNKLTILDLTPVPELQVLDCDGNQLSDLKFTATPKLQKLNCGHNPLVNLDLTPLPELQVLSCGYNQLSTFNLTPVPKLEELYCHCNELTDLDLTPVPDLQKLDCGGNPLTELDLTPVPGLQWIRCDRRLKITGAPSNLEVYHS